MNTVIELKDRLLTFIVPEVEAVQYYAQLDAHGASSEYAYIIADFDGQVVEMEVEDWITLRSEPETNILVHIDLKRKYGIF